MALPNRDPARAENERQRGNELFEKQKYPEAMTAYTSAIKWNPDDPATYRRRAACCIEWKDFDLGLKDCNTSIELDPASIEGYILKGVVLKEQRQFASAMKSFRKAIELDENNKEAINGYRVCMVAMDNDPDQVKARALSDPAIRNILDDPEMKRVLEQMQERPEAARKHLQKPDVAAKIQKLVQCGVIRFC